MKLIDDSGQGFKPFEMTLCFESEGEARLMWHVFNRLDLWESISRGQGYRDGDYIIPCNDFTEHFEIKAFIASHVSIKRK